MNLDSLFLSPICGIAEENTPLNQISPSGTGLSIHSFDETSEWQAWNHRISSVHLAFIIHLSNF
jgi:hypothetical protein